MTKRYYGPFTVKIDDDNQVVTVELKRRGPKLWRLGLGEIERLRTHVLKVASNTGYTVIEV